MYVTAVSEEDTARGVAVGKVVAFQYWGQQEGKHVLLSAIDGGGPSIRYECADPCKIIKMTLGNGTSRIPYNPASIVGSAFEDALSGKLAVAKAPAGNVVGSTSAATIPAAFIGEWNEDANACGTGLNDTALRVRPTKVEFYESDAEVRSVKMHNARAVTVEGSFAGEGEAWNNSFKMVLSQSGDSLTVDGSTRQRCPS